MEQFKDDAGMLDLIIRPAFCVKDGLIARINQAAQCLTLRVGDTLHPLLHTGSDEYGEFQGGQLYLTLNIGGMLLGAIFMATDYTTSPITFKGKIIFAVGCGVITSLIRIFGSLPEGVSFSIILMNILVPHIENMTTPKPFGAVKEKKAKGEAMA